MKSTNATPPAIRISNLVKDYASGLRGMKLRAVDHVTITVEENQVFGLLGPNGSGKSTTIKALLGLVEPTAGECEIFGTSSRRTQSRSAVGYLPEAPYFYRYLSGRELVAYCARICAVPRARLSARVSEVIDMVGLTDAADRRVGTYSKGMLQRIGLAQAVVHDPRLLILDEPTAGVDPVGAAEIARLILRLKREGKTILLCSHLLAQVEGVCDRIAILDRGRMVLEGRVDELVSDQSRDALIVEGLAAGARDELREWLAGRGARLAAITRPRTSLDEVFLRHVGQRGADGRSPAEENAK